ncbi:MAG: cobalamin biosynthesis protein CbiM [Candidatus Latescibacteria bacterium]|nr:cobalamin biosynthesis protein CbiM [Candidatus Latescibacterota bacterium]
MHVPDGFITPKLYLPAYAVSAGLWGIALRRFRARLDEETLPRLAATTALAFVLMAIALPLPGGTSAHATGIALLALLFGVWSSFLAISLVLLLQAVLFGEGGITSLPVNALAMGLLGTSVAVLSFRLLRRIGEPVALFAAGWLALNVSAAATALVLGVQPAIARSAEGTPLFFPFGPEVVLPAVLIPHALLGVGEGLLTLFAYRIAKRVENR